MLCSVIIRSNEVIVVGGYSKESNESTESCKINGDSMTCTTREPKKAEFAFYPELMPISQIVTDKYEHTEASLISGYAVCRFENFLKIYFLSYIDKFLHCLSLELFNIIRYVTVTFLLALA